MEGIKHDIKITRGRAREKNDGSRGQQDEGFGGPILLALKMKEGPRAKESRQPLDAAKAMNVNVGIRAAVALLGQFYEKKKVLTVSTPTAGNLLYRLQQS